ncbi:MAG: PEP-CTERM sorting domain-containing protein [Phycisphaerae bacterium]|jgi:hypothetical protein|nr:PEP-CTERM sorting domain-containing protein [Phycisphaerae bacterium]
MGGKIDEIALFDTALSQADIQSIKDNGVAAFIPEPSTFALTAVGLLGLLRRRRKRA